MTMLRGRFPLVVFVAALSLLALTERGAYAQTEWINALRQGGYVIVFRHGATHQDQADTDPLNFKNIAQQRQLNDAGRAKVKEIGEAFRKLRIPVGQIQSSAFNRAVETGTLMGLGEVTSTPISCSSLISPIFSMPSARTGSTCAKARRRCSSRAAADIN